MLIDRDHPLVQPLVRQWEVSKKLMSEKKSWSFGLRLERRLAHEITAQAKEFRGQLVLKYHEFLSMVPTGEHSFAHGSVMGSQTVYWVTVARLSEEVALTATKLRRRTIDYGEFKRRLVFPPQYSLAVVWQRTLWPIYRGESFRPVFVLERPNKKPETPPDQEETRLLSIESLGNHLFSLRQGEHDWATKIEVVLGTSAVEQWLVEHRSAETFKQLNTLHKLA